MIPIKDKKYFINCQGPYDYNSYMGGGVFTGEVTDFGDETCYGFIIPTEKEVCFFVEEEIVAEIVGVVQQKNNMSKDYNSGLDTAARIVEELIGRTEEGETILCGIESSKIDSENNYCETCDSCGETGCCPPINCQAVKCKYGEINLKDYECFQNQWEIMHNALKELADFDGNKIAINALNAVDKEWDKLYSKESND